MNLPYLLKMIPRFVKHSGHAVIVVQTIAELLPKDGLEQLGEFLGNLWKEKDDAERAAAQQAEADQKQADLVAQHHAEAAERSEQEEREAGEAAIAAAAEGSERIQGASESGDEINEHIKAVVAAHVVNELNALPIDEEAGDESEEEDQQEEKNQGADTPRSPGEESEPTPTPDPVPPPAAPAPKRKWTPAKK